MSTEKKITERAVTVFKELNIRSIQVMVLLEQLFTWQGEGRKKITFCNTKNRHS